jgi:hypothetical protein
LREISRLIAIKVAQTARDEGFGRALDDAAIKAEIEASCWFPDYPSFPPQPPGKPGPVREQTA